MQESSGDVGWGIPLAPPEDNKRVIRLIVGAGVVAFGLAVVDLVVTLGVV